MKEADGSHDKMSSMVWICTTTQQGTRVFVIDANNPADVLDAFHVTSSHILCISSVPGKLFAVNELPIYVYLVPGVQHRP